MLNAKDVSYNLKDRGLVAKQMRDTIIRFSPALMITEEQLREGIDIIVDTINSMPVKA